MGTRNVCRLIVLAFSLALGWLAWRVFGPAYVPKYFVGGPVTALASCDPDAKVLYLRYTLHLSQRPRHAWLQVLARDQLAVYINGALLISKENSGLTATALADPTPHLQVGANVIAICAHQTSIDRPPVVAVEGGYLTSDGEHRFGAEAEWYCSTVFQREGTWWFSGQFDERRLPSPRRVSCELRGDAGQPPRATTAPPGGKWITLPGSGDASVAMRREFTLQGRPRSAWLRLTSACPYRLAVNGMILEEEEQQLAVSRPYSPLRRSYDLSEFLRPGKNAVVLLLTQPSGTARINADMEVEDALGRWSRLDSDDRWQGQAGTPADWYTPPRESTANWQPCRAETGDLGILPWQPRRELGHLSLPLLETVRQLALLAGLIAVLAVLTAAACRLIEIALASLRGTSGRDADSPEVYYALLPATLAVGAGILAVYDPRIARQDVYRAEWMALAVASVVLQWAWLAMAAWRWKSSPQPAAMRKSTWRAIWPGALVLGLVVLGFWLRLETIGADPLQADEVMQYNAVQGIWDRGFPSLVVDPDLPPSYVSTSEILYYVLAVASLFFQSDLYIIRFPAVVFGTLSIWLLYVVGRRMFHRNAGLIAAAICALSPICIQMSDFGRYPSQLQFMTLLTVYLFWRTIDVPGAINRRFLWLTTLSFAGMYLTWEGAGLLALGMVFAFLLHRRGRL
ncbi:MAG: glycosyltransferase family 39 protein, partial [Thermoguttaceae bacterium]